MLVGRCYSELSGHKLQGRVLRLDLAELGAVSLLADHLFHDRA
jgi:hypothetical protein